MLLEVQDSSSMKKLQQILAARYGVKVELKTVSEVNDLFQEEVVNDDGDLIVPICHQSRYLATALVSDASQLNVPDQVAISNLVQMYLENPIYNWYLTQQEQIQYSKKGFTNLKPVDDDFDSANLDFENMNPVSFAEKKSLKIFSFEQSSNKTNGGHLLNRLALKIHEKSERWAFLSFKDISSQVKSVRDLTDMGAITLFIEDVMALDVNSQKLISEYIQLTKSESNVTSISGEPIAEGIQFIFGFSVGLKELSTNLDSSFYSILKETHIEMARLPMDKEKLDATLQLLV